MSDINWLNKQLKHSRQESPWAKLSPHTLSNYFDKKELTQCSLMWADLLHIADFVIKIV